MSWAAGGFVNLAARLSWLCLLSLAAAGQGEMTADQVLQHYLQAVGGYENISAVHTFVKKGEISGQLFRQSFSAPSLSKDHVNFESYFKSPNLRLYLVLNKERAPLWMTGCDGQISWSIGPNGQRYTQEPTASRPYHCKTGVDLLPIDFLDPNVKTKLKGKKKFGDRQAWEVRVENSKERTTQTFFIDDHSYLLIRLDQGLAHFIYSDYREVDGIKIPFSIKREGEIDTTDTLREIDINPPLDEIRFDGLPGSRTPAKKIEHDQSHPSIETATEAKETPAPEATTVAPTGPPALPTATYVKTINFVSCSLAELRTTIPELKGVKEIEERQQLDSLLQRVGEKAMELDRQIPNLISHEKILESQASLKDTQEEFSYLVLSKRSGDSRVLEEYRVDLKTGDAVEMGATGKNGETTTSQEAVLQSLSRASSKVNESRKGAAPLTQGFASMWVNFYPSNRQGSAFRLIGTQKMDRHQTYVIAFAQKPGAGQLPGEVRFEGKSMPVYYQGIAWIDSADFRIVRLRTDLLPPVADLPITQLTANIQFANTKTQGFNTELWLPHEVDVTSEFSGRVFHNKHLYSNYRSFQAHARLVIPQ